MLVILVPVTVTGLGFTYHIVTGRVLPGVTVGGLPAGGQRPAALTQQLDQAWNGQKMLLATDGARSWPVAPAQLGLRVDAAETARRAYSVGRGDNALAEALWLARFGSLPVAPVLAFNPAAGQAGLEQLAAQVAVPAQDAALRLENGEWAAVPGQNGSRMNIVETLRLLAADPAAVLNNGALPVVTDPVAPRVSDLTPVLSQVREAASRPLTLQAYDPITNETLPIDVPREVLAGWIAVEPAGPDGIDVSIALDGQQMRAYLEQWQASLGPARTLEPFSPPEDLTARWQNGQPVTAIVRHNPTSYRVQPGETLSRIAFTVGMPYWKIQQANPNIDPDFLRAGQELVIPSKNDMLPLPIITNKRIVISISQQHLWTYENNAPRSEHVISTGIDRSPTIPGIYQVRTHELSAYASVWDLTMPHFMGIYEGWPGFMNGLHGLPTLSSGRQLWAGNLGQPVSYGCIILDLDEAEDLYHWAEEGVVVEIQP